MSLFKTQEEKALLLLASLRDEMRGLRVVVELLAMKQQAVPLPDEPDASAFLVQDDGDFALLEKLRLQNPSDEADLLAEHELQQEPEGPVPTKIPPGSFLPRFQR